MSSSNLSPEAIRVIDQYRNLPFKTPGVSCPYFINRRQKIRGSLRALIGKGSPKDIAEEATIIGLKQKVDIRSFDATELKKFLVDHRLGIDCSGFVYYVLDAELRARGKGALKKYLRFPEIKNPLRKLIIALRPVENTDVNILADDVNSIVVPLNEIRPCDMIVMKNAGRNHDRDHILLISNVDNSTVSYVHAFYWSTDGQYNHGVKQGKIHLLDTKKTLLEQRWEEVTCPAQGGSKTNEENETYLHAKNAELVELRRLKILLS